MAKIYLHEPLAHLLKGKIPTKGKGGRGSFFNIAHIKKDEKTWR